MEGCSIPRNTKLLFVYGQDLSTFIEKDLNILKGYYRVSDVAATGRFYKYMGKLWRGVRSSDVNFTWFATDQAAVTVFFSRLLGKRSVVVSGGGEVSDVADIDYGGQRHFKVRHLSRYALNHADLVISISEYTDMETRMVSHPKKLVMIYHGLDPERYRPSGPKEDLVITIGGVNWSNLKRKGLETFVRCAKHVPDVPFKLIGRFQDDSIDHLRSIATPNVEFTGFMDFDEMLRHMQRAKVYVQVSGHEGFGLSNAEAMLCECVPVVSGRGALPEVVGKTGFTVPFDDPKATGEAIRKALRSGKGKAARKRIAVRFPLEKRRKRIIEEVEAILGRG